MNTRVTMLSLQFRVKALAGFDDRNGKVDENLELKLQIRIRWTTVNPHTRINMSLCTPIRYKLSSSMTSLDDLIGLIKTFYQI